MLKPYHLHNDNGKIVTTTARAQQPLDNCTPLDAAAHHQFRATVGQLIWASLERPDLMCADKLHSSRVQHPTTSDAASLKHTLRYIKPSWIIVLSLVDIFNVECVSGMVNPFPSTSMLTQTAIGQATSRLERALRDTSSAFWESLSALHPGHNVPSVAAQQKRSSWHLAVDSMSPSTSCSSSKRLRMA